MINNKTLKFLSLTFMVVMIVVIGSRATEAAIDHMEGRAKTVRAIVSDNSVEELTKVKKNTEADVKASDEPVTVKNSKPEPEADKWSFTPEEMDIFARLVHAEAKGEPYDGKVAVAAAILNRIEGDVYPDDLKSVVFQVDSGYYQFSPVLDGSIWQTPDEVAFKAIEDAMEGADPSKGAISFYNPQKTGNKWVRQQTVTTVIGNHVFFKLAQ